jgi:hypothetical protein
MPLWLAPSVALLLLPSCTTPAQRAGLPPPSPAVLPTADAPTIISIEPWSFEGVPGRIIRTASYRLFTTEDDTSVVSRLPAFQEAALNQYTSLLAPLPRPPQALDTFLLSSRAQWASLTRQLMGHDSDVYLRIPRGGYAAGGRAVLYSIGTHDTLAIAAHEGWHQYTQRTFKEPLPVWLEEGIAVTMEGFHLQGPHAERAEFLPWANPERFEQLRRAAGRGELLALEDLLEATPQDLLAKSSEATLTYYAQVWSLVQFLREGAGARYQAPLAKLLTDAAAGQMSARLALGLGSVGARKAIDARRGRAVFTAFLNPNLEEAGREYRAFLDEVTRRTSREKIWAGHSPIAPASPAPHEAPAAH